MSKKGYKSVIFSTKHCMGINIIKPLVHNQINDMSLGTAETRSFIIV